MKSLFDLFKKPKIKDSPKKIISFDGGGVRAIAGIIFLNKFENATGKIEIVGMWKDHFDNLLNCVKGKDLRINSLVPFLILRL